MTNRPPRNYEKLPSFLPTAHLALPPLNQSKFYSSVAAAELQFGQPIHETHPHLLRAGELTPGISALEYAQRRSKLASKLPDNAIAVLASAEVKYRSGAVFYEFHQESNFFYLTGFNEPEALAVIAKGQEKDEHIFHLYVRPKDSKAEQWEGARSGLEAAEDVFNADETGDINSLTSILSPIVSSASSVYTDIPLKESPTTVFSRFFSSPASKSEGFAKLLKASKVQPLKPLINDIRAFKSDAEVSNMRKAGQDSGRAFTDVMRQEWTREKDLGNYLEYEFKRRGCDGSAYVPVIAGGEHALSIHYVRNDDILREGNLVLVDAGGVYINTFPLVYKVTMLTAAQEFGNYITDITRTFPPSSRFTKSQADLYNAILGVQRTCVSLCRASANMTLDNLHAIAERALKVSLADLGFDISGNAMEVLFPHHLSHYIGLDVHDTPGYSRKEILKPGHCVTVEPGIYVPNNDRWPKHFRGMGIRIEDSIVVQEDGPYVLTTEAVKEVRVDKLFTVRIVSNVRGYQIVDIEALRS
ncbi:hypothetical protein MMC26_001736 [Xylographa opegraphella]|nr:hypothetical protein [Xylographa opegraphella]